MDYWGPKIHTNRERDAKRIAQLKEQGWDALVVWQCELKDRESVFSKLAGYLGPPRTGE
jgi:DNA mismatch endonuclease (patch repair protein)